MIAVEYVGTGPDGSASDRNSDMKTALIGAAVMLPVLAGCSQDSLSRPLVGAIRWDAWSGGSVTREVERSLGPKEYHHRLPWFAKVIDDNAVSIDGGRQEVMEHEIAFAADASLDYWAFLLYPESNSMSVGLKQYLSSPNRRRINFCLILHNALGVSDRQWPAERDRAVALLKEPGYQTVLDGRPLVFAFQAYYRGEFPAGRFREFLGKARDAGLNPYCVWMGWNPRGDRARALSLGFEAVSAYARDGDQPAFSQLAESVEETFWNAADRARVPCVPLVTTGWDKRPRKDHPVSWEMDQAYHKQDVFPSTATPEEIATHLKRAMAFVDQNPRLCAAGAVIIYAWNEYDEGGWLAPTWTAEGKPNTDRLDAIAKVLRTGRTASQR
jgi:hypothetical protein